MKYEVERIKRISTGEKLREKIRRKEKIKLEKWIGEIINGVVRNIEKEKKEERRMEMREIREEIQRVIRMEKVAEKRTMRYVFKEPIEPMEICLEKEKCEKEKKSGEHTNENDFNKVVRKEREMGEVIETMRSKEQEKKNEKRRRKLRLIGKINRENNEKRCGRLIGTDETVGRRKRRRPGGSYKYNDVKREMEKIENGTIIKLSPMGKGGGEERGDHSIKR